jgi:hypothetical protein
MSVIRPGLKHFSAEGAAQTNEERSRPETPHHDHHLEIQILKQQWALPPQSRQSEAVIHLRTLWSKRVAAAKWENLSKALQGAECHHS